MNDEAQPREALEALTEVKRRRDQVIEGTLVPTWYWWAVAVPTVGLGVVVDSRNAVAIPIAAAVFAIGVALLTAWIVFGGRGQVKVYEGLLGPDGAGAIVGFVGVVVAGSIGLAFALQAASFRYPGTLSTFACAVALVVGGPALMRLLQHIMLRNRAGSGR